MVVKSDAVCFFGRSLHAERFSFLVILISSYKIIVDRKRPTALLLEEKRIFGTQIRHTKFCILSMLGFVKLLSSHRIADNCDDCLHKMACKWFVVESELMVDTIADRKAQTTRSSYNEDFYS
ncbi:hypothetical protein BD560DRAFT_429092 [Blakeslea trispora]|nr:hypothetical protein BD560DRAFT_429461 [Blakeslea trispora]KAI8331109.1 hypothetical protein BD560DRAFT_429087 [Blakeslea trispora]KAI8331110.1 hypothetical protein BD560DRAFT_429089 [Blakeslea trispora]KAI8331113.1 hypothetical protein BD560DRAFT_429092 [Blakeslea trispora]